MKIVFTSNEVKAFNSYVNAVQASMKKVMNLLSIAKGGEPTAPKIEELTAAEWRKSLSEARTSGAFNQAEYANDGSVIIDIKEEWVISGLNTTRRIFDKYVDLGVTLAVMAKQLFGGFDAEVKNIVNDEMGALLQKQKTDVPELRAIEVEADVIQIEVAVEAGADRSEVANLVAGFKRPFWVSKEQAKRILHSLSAYDPDAAGKFTIESDDEKLVDSVDSVVSIWTAIVAK